MRPSEKLALHREKVLNLVERAGASNLRIFGSAARGEDNEGSDLDLLVKAGPRMSLIDLASLRLNLEAALGVSVDLLTDGGIHPLLKDKVLADARPI